MGITRQQIENLVGFRVNDEKLYQKAFTHKSATTVLDSYETLEFVGDSVISFIVTKYLFDTYQGQQEGFLTKARTRIVRGKTLAAIAKNLGLEQFIEMDEKGLRNNWNSNPKILEDVYEALVGAVYLDVGLVYAREFVLRTLDIENMSLEDDNYKDQLMRWCQSSKKQLPVYTYTQYPNGTFSASVQIDGVVLATGYGKTKKDAEQNAAQCVFKQ
jgi:ribonuclease-3